MSANKNPRDEYRYGPEEAKLYRPAKMRNLHQLAAECENAFVAKVNLPFYLEDWDHFKRINRWWLRFLRWLIPGQDVWKDAEFFKAQVGEGPVEEIPPVEEVPEERKIIPAPVKNPEPANPPTEKEPPPGGELP